MTGLVNGGTGKPAGSATNLQYNNSGIFGGVSGSSTNGSEQITLTGATTTSPGWYAQLSGDTTPRVRIGLNTTDTASVGFGNGSVARDLFLERAGAATIRQGGADAAAPIAQTHIVQNVVAGTSNTAGVNYTVAGSQGTGTGVGGSLLFQVAPAGTTGTAQNALSTALTISTTANTSALQLIAGANGAASLASLLLNGTVFTGGSGTTNFPALFIQPSGTTAATTWSTSGTGLGMNLASGFAGNFLDFHSGGGVSNFLVSSSGTISIANSSTVISGATSASAWTINGKGFRQTAAIWTDTSSSGTIAAEYINVFAAPTLAFSNATTVTNAYNTYFTDPVAGTNATLTAKWALGADSASIGGTRTTSAGAILGASDIQAAGASTIAWSARSRLASSSDGLINLFNNAQTGFTRLNFGGTTSSFPSLKVSSATLQGRLADDSAFTFVQAKLQTDTNATTGLTAGVLATLTNASIVLYDATGQAYRVPCVI